MMCAAACRQGHMAAAVHTELLPCSINTAPPLSEHCLTALSSHRNKQVALGQRWHPYGVSWVCRQPWET
eukprot:6473001-Amphidinium_carterae.1